MKDFKKVPVKQLEKFSNLFTQLGLVLVLFIVYITLEYQTSKKSVADFKTDKNKVVYITPETEVLFTKEAKAKPKVILPKQTKLIPDEVVKGNNNIIETIIDNTPTKNPEIIDIENIVEIKEPVEIIEDVPYDFIQDAPVFKGCEGLNKKENKVCFDKKMKQFVQRNFDLNLANDLGLHAGKHKIQTQFIIDDKGNVVDILVRTPSKGLEKEAKRIIKKLPKFKPGKQQNKTVKVRYTLPISISIN
ncbi:energy transducer TonB [Polaribacter sp.]|uniref:energy transducer TonB n=1 Tax=Polaribacter sp. TaxID=1920175 RepID=UPI003EF10945